MCHKNKTVDPTTAEEGKIEKPKLLGN